MEGGQGCVLAFVYLDHCVTRLFSYTGTLLAIRNQGSFSWFGLNLSVVKRCLLTLNKEITVQCQRQLCHLTLTQALLGGFNLNVSVPHFTSLLPHSYKCADVIGGYGTCATNSKQVEDPVLKCL